MGAQLGAYFVALFMGAQLGIGKSLIFFIWERLAHVALSVAEHSCSEGTFRRKNCCVKERIEREKHD
jgi:hypothetical protein